MANRDIDLAQEISDLKRELLALKSAQRISGGSIVLNSTEKITISDGTVTFFEISADGIKIFDQSDERIRIGKLPDSSYGEVITKPGQDVEDVF